MFSFSVIRKPHLPNPVLIQASEMKERILDFGGRFFKFVINGCSTIQTLEQYLILEHGLNRVVVEDAISRMLVTTNKNIDGSVMDIWLIDETNNGIRDDSFAGYAFTEAELVVPEKVRNRFQAG